MKRELINTIKIDAANLEFIAKTGKINGTLLIEIERVMTEYARQQANGAERSSDKCHIQNVSFSLPNDGEIQKLYKDEMKKWKGTSWHTELEYHGDLFIDGAKAVVAYLKGNES